MPAEEIVFEQPVTDQAATPETPEAEATAQAEPKAEGEAAPEQTKDEAQRDDKGRFKRPIQPRIDELTRAKHEAEREAAYWRGIAEAGKAPSAKADAPSKPTPDQFSDHNEYVEKLAEWKAKEIVSASLRERDEQAEQAKQKTERETRASTWAERQAKFAETAPDFDEVLASAEVQVPAHLLDALLKSDQGPALAYHLAKNPEVAQNIAGMSKDDALMELGALKASLSKPALKSVTKAPAPITPVKSGGGNVPDVAKMSQTEYEAYRKTQGAWWAR